MADPLSTANTAAVAAVTAEEKNIIAAHAGPIEQIYPPGPPPMEQIYPPGPPPTADNKPVTGTWRSGEELVDSAARVQKVSTNPLHEYESYTYSLSWHLVTTKQFNDLINNPEKSYVPKNVLVSSAGRYGSTFVRDSNFTEDFYFEDFKMTSYVNTTKRNRSSNLIECSFTLIEPGGFTLLNRLIAAVEGLNMKVIGSAENYTKVPYILQIDFFGSKDGKLSEGPIKVNGESMTKTIPICLVGIKSRVTSRGTEYQIQAVPFNHQAFNQMNAPSPAALQIKGTTVSELLGSGQIDDTFIKAQRETESARSILRTDLAGWMTPEEYADFSSKAHRAFRTTGFTDALNSWQERLVINKQIKLANKIKVVFDPEIGDAKLFSSSNAPVTEAASANSTPANTARAAGNLPVGSLNFDGQIITVPLGQPLDQLIDWAVRNSDYVRRQMTDPTKPIGNPSEAITSTGGPLNWYRIIPKIEIGEYDIDRNMYQFNTTLYVKKWTLNTIYPYAPRGRTPGFVKQYDWLFTGQNKDVLDMQIDFDMMYYVQMTAMTSKNTLFESGASTKVKSDGSTAADASSTPVSKGRVQPISINCVGTNKTFISVNGVDQATAICAADAQQSFMLSARGDMINLKLKIVGDPQFIKQDDIFFNQGLESPAGQFTKNNSLVTDAGELYIFVTFHSPIDYDERTGLAVPYIQPNKYGYQNPTYNSEFTGVYKLIKVESQFTKGKFEQVLDLARLPIYDDPSYAKQTIQQRIDSYLYLGLGQSVAAGAAGRFAGPRILQNQLNNLATPIYNAGSQLATSLGGAGGLGGLVSSAINAASNKLINKGIEMVGDKVNSVFADFKFSQAMEEFNAQASAEGLSQTYEEAAAVIENSYNSLDAAAGALGELSDLPVDEIINFSPEEVANFLEWF